MFEPATALRIDASQQKRLEQLVRSAKSSQRILLRARVVLLASQGLPNHAIARQLDTSRPTVLLWRGRFKQFGLPGLMRDRPRPGRKRALSAEKVKAVVEATQQTTPVGTTDWSVRSMAKAHGLSRMAVQRIWKSHKLQPHRLRSFFSDPQFVEKLREVVGLHLDRSDNALAFSVDEKGETQALDQAARLLALHPEISSRQFREYKRRVTTALFEALSLLNFRVIGEHLPRHRSAEFIRFLDKIDRETPTELNVHLIVGNNSTFKSPSVKRWLKVHRSFHLHAIPSSRSWFNLVERWFGEITRRRIRRGAFQSVTELTEAIDPYLKAHIQNPKRFVWTKVEGISDWPKFISVGR